MRSLFLTCLASCLTPIMAMAEPLTPLSFRSALEVAKLYAADRTLVFYCLGQDPEMVAFTYMIVHVEIEEALVKLRAAGSSAEQNAQLVQTVMTNVRFPTPGASDPAVDAECRDKKVADNYFIFNGSFSVPLAHRRPFNSLTR